MKFFYVLLSAFLFFMAFIFLAIGNLILALIFFIGGIIVFKKIGISFWCLIGTLLFIDIFTD